MREVVIDPRISAYVDGFSDGGHEVLDELEAALDLGLADADAIQGWIATIRERLARVPIQVPSRAQAALIADHDRHGHGRGPRPHPPRKIVPADGFDAAPEGE